MPSVLLFYLFEKKKELKFLLFFVIFLKLLYIYNFFSISPYQYSYFNIFAGKNSLKHQKFEVDYWSTSLEELVKKIDYKYIKNKKLSTCGFDVNLVKKLFNKHHRSVPNFVSEKEFDYIIIINRVLHDGSNTCDNYIKGEILIKVERNNQIFSYIKKNINEI